MSKSKKGITVKLSVYRYSDGSEVFALLKDFDFLPASLHCKKGLSRLQKSIEDFVYHEFDVEMFELRLFGLNLALLYYGLHSLLLQKAFCPQCFSYLEGVRFPIYFIPLAPSSSSTDFVLENSGLYYMLNVVEK